jgi:hypothetical protein
MAILKRTRVRDKNNKNNKKSIGPENENDKDECREQ